MGQVLNTTMGLERESKAAAVRIPGGARCGTGQGGGDLWVYRGGGRDQLRGSQEEKGPGLGQGVDRQPRYATHVDFILALLLSARCLMGERPY